MDQNELGVALAVAHLAELRRQADRGRLASRIPGRTARRRGNRTPGSPRVLGRHGQAADRVVAAGGPGPATEASAMLAQHRHQPGLFDPGHCRACARRAVAASRRASVALWSSGAGILLAAVALLRG